MSDIQDYFEYDYFEYISKKYREKTNNSSIRIYVNKMENRITFNINTGNDLKLVRPETMKLTVSNKSKITKDKNGEKYLC